MTIPAKGTGEPFGSLRTAARKRYCTPYRASDMKKRRYVGTALVRLWNSGCQSRSPNWRQRAHCCKRFPARQVQTTANFQRQTCVTSIPRALLVAIASMLRWRVAIVVVGRHTTLPAWRDSPCGHAFQFLGLLRRHDGLPLRVCLGLAGHRVDELCEELLTPVNSRQSTPARCAGPALRPSDFAWRETVNPQLFGSIKGANSASVNSLLFHEPSS